MNRNVESHFATTANIDIRRSTFDRSQDIKFSFNVGELIPFYVDECLPGDTFKVQTSKVVRLQTLLTPVLDNLYLDTYFFFVPYRLCWTHFRELMGENTQSAWIPQVEYKVPQIGMFYLNTEDDDDGDRRNKPGDFLDYMGVPVNVPIAKGTQSTTTNAYLAGEVLECSALPYRAMCLIWNEWFRDENLQDPYNVYLGDSDVILPSITEREAAPTQYVNGKNLFYVNKYHDYFSSALPAPLKSEPIMAPVTNKNPAIPWMPVGSQNLDHEFSNSRLHLTAGTSGYVVGSQQVKNTSDLTVAVPNLSVNGTDRFGPLNLYGDLSSIGINIMQLRNAFQVQKFFERSSRSGSRYIETIKAHFSVNSPDSRLQRPEYLGGNRIPISIHQITNQSQGEQDFLGDLGAMSLTTDHNEDFVQSFTEHGVVIGLCCARYDHSFPQGLERFWSRKTMFDFYWPEFSALSEQGIRNKELYAQGTTTDNEIFGYQEAWADYRYKPNRTAGEMRPGIPNTLASWHFADYYESLPTLSDGWIREDKTNVDRTLAVTSAVADQIFCDVYVKNISTRPMPVRSIPGLADHF